MENMKIKIITGFNDDQKFVIDADEAHKAYYLFRNPDKRGVFSNGLALLGRDIRAIQPDYNTTMGWKPTHKLDEDDWDQLRKEGIILSMKQVMSHANSIAYQISNNPHLLNQKLSDVLLPEAPEELKPLIDGINKI